MKYANNINSSVKVFNKIPDFWVTKEGKKIDGFQYASIQVLNENGFFEIFFPVKTENQRYVSLNNISQNWFNEASKQYIVPVEEIPPLSSAEITQQKLEATKQKYELHKANGWEAYQDFRAQIVEEIAAGLITEVQAFQIEGLLNVAYNRISQTGDWKTAGYELQQLPAPTDFKLPYYQKALQEIATYIATNYE